MTKFRDHDYVETEESFFFTVVGYLHPPDGVLAYLKYVPGKGPWRRDGLTFKRIIQIYSMEELIGSIKLLKEDRPYYVRYDPVIGEEMSFVPNNRIKKHYSTIDIAKGLRKKEQPDPIEARALELMDILSNISGISTEKFGITGSLLVGIHHEESDVDIVVEGRDECKKLIESLNSTDQVNCITRLRDKDKAKWISTCTKKYPLSIEDLARLSSRIRNKYVYKGQVFSIHGIKAYQDIKESYGEIIYRRIGIGRAIAEVEDVSDSYFTPAIYRIRVIDYSGPVSNDIREVACFDTNFAFMFKEGDVIEVLGKLERVYDKRSNETYLRINVGSFVAASKEYIRLKN